MSEPANNVAKFTGNTENAREHVTFAVADLAAEFAKAYEVGYRAGLNDLDPSPSERMRLLTYHSLSYQTRVDLYEAIIRTHLERGRVA